MHKATQFRESLFGLASRLAREDGDSREAELHVGGAFQPMQVLYNEPSEATRVVAETKIGVGMADGNLDSIRAHILVNAEGLHRIVGVVLTGASC